MEWGSERERLRERGSQDRKGLCKPKGGRPEVEMNYVRVTPVRGTQEEDGWVPLGGEDTEFRQLLRLTQ